MKDWLYRQIRNLVGNCEANLVFRLSVRIWVFDINYIVLVNMPKLHVIFINYMVLVYKQVWPVPSIFCSRNFMISSKCEYIKKLNGFTSRIITRWRPENVKRYVWFQRFICYLNKSLGYLLKFSKRFTIKQKVELCVWTRLRLHSW